VFDSLSILIVSISIGNAVVTLVLIRWFKLRDCYVGVIGMLSRIVAVPIFAFGFVTWHMYAGEFKGSMSLPGNVFLMISYDTAFVLGLTMRLLNLHFTAKAVSALSAAAIISMRSLATKMVTPDELGEPPYTESLRVSFSRTGWEKIGILNETLAPSSDSSPN